MAQITDYDSLQANIAEYLKRTDLTDKIKTFIQLAEARIFSEPKFNLRILETRVTQDTVADQKYYTLPTDFKSIKHIKITLDTTRVRVLQRLPVERFDRVYGNDESLVDILDGNVEAYAMFADEFALGPTPKTVLEMEIFYNAKWAELSDAAPTNWLITNQPDLYLYGSLAESAPYLVDDTRLATWAALYKESKERIVEQDRKDRIADGGSELHTEISYTMDNYQRRGYWY